MPSKPVKRPISDETVEILSEEMDTSRPDFVFKPNELHAWRQHGPYLVCKSCEIEHAVFIGMSSVLVGIDTEGKPILKKR